MRIINTVKKLRAEIKKLRAQNKKIGFVPTMGALHEGHLSLLRKARRENDLVVLSIFVNPAQFGPKEDFDKYPRQRKKDELLAKKENVDIIFYPSVEEVYAKDHLTYVEVSGMQDTLCGLSRPGHFRGVATIVTKLLNMVDPDTLYLGQKDGQQAVLLKKLVSDLNFDCRVKICPTVREANGLAMSSRNSYLTDAQRKNAGLLFQALTEAGKKTAQGERNAAKIKSLIKKRILKELPGAEIEYVTCVGAENLKTQTKLKGRVLVALAVRFSGVRLIDNILLNAN